MPTKMTGYTNCLYLSQMKYFDLFDDIEYKYIKNIINLDEETDFEVEIEDIYDEDTNDYRTCKTQFTFTLEINISGGSLPSMCKKKFVVVNTYDESSQMAMVLIDLKNDEESEEEDDD